VLLTATDVTGRHPLLPVNGVRTPFAANRRAIRVKVRGTSHPRSEPRPRDDSPRPVTTITRCPRLFCRVLVASRAPPRVRFVILPFLRMGGTPTAISKCDKFLSVLGPVCRLLAKFGSKVRLQVSIKVHHTLFVGPSWHLPLQGVQVQVEGLGRLGRTLSRLLAPRTWCTLDSLRLRRLRAAVASILQRYPSWVRGLQGHRVPRARCQGRSPCVGVPLAHRRRSAAISACRCATGGRWRKGISSRRSCTDVGHL
jgi:hypothetical protein